MKHAILLAITATCVTAGCDSRSDPEKLQGKWRLEEMDGWFDFCPPAAKADGPFMTFSDDKFTYEFGPDTRGRIRSVSGSFTCDLTKNPKEITFVFGGRTVVGIYKVSSSALRICIGEKDDVPPTEFAGGAPRFKTARPALLIFERTQHH